MVILSLITLIAIIQAYRSYPQLAPTREETMAAMIRDIEHEQITSILTTGYHQSSWLSTCHAAISGSKAGAAVVVVVAGAG